MSQKLELTPRDTNMLKGIAVLFLLAHHLFIYPARPFDDVFVFGIPLINWIGDASKLCVALFVFLSGYGLTRSSERSDYFSLRNYFSKRFKRIFIDYWLVWIVFVLPGIFLLGRPIEEAYVGNPVKDCILDLAGILNMTGRVSYNATWWFFSCILLLYLLFPLLRIALRSHTGTIMTLIISLSLCIFGRVTFIQCIRFYLFPFVLGIIFANGQFCSLFRRRLHRLVCSLIGGQLSLTKTALLAVCTLAAFMLRNCAEFVINIGPLLFDSVLALLIVLTYVNMKGLFAAETLSDKFVTSHLSRFLNFCGQHSYNIFMVHTFFYYYYFPDYISWSTNPALIFITLLLTSLLASVMLSYIRQKLTLLFTTLFPRSGRNQALPVSRD